MREGKAMKEIYPLTIVRDRYTGAYSGGEFIAWPMEYFQIPEDPQADDTACMLFWIWAEGNSIPYGRGKTPEEALRDLQERLPEDWNYYDEVDVFWGLR